MSLWPTNDRRFFNVEVPVPLEQYLERLAALGIIGCTTQEVAVYLLREGLEQRAAELRADGWLPNPEKYRKAREVAACAR